MPAKGIVFFTVLLTVISFTGAVFAMSPQIKLPEWNKTRISVTEFDSEQNLLEIQVEIAAEKIALRNISSKVHVPKEVSMKAETRERKILKPGDKAVFIHRLNIKPEFYGWLEVDLRAQPDQEQMIELVKKIHASEPVASAILQEEAKAITQPIYIGTSMPVLVRKDIALSSSEEMAFRPDLKVNKSDFYLWYPPSGIGRGITAESLREFDKAIRMANHGRAVAAANLILKKFADLSESLSLEKADGETFMIPYGILSDMINANLLTLKAIETRNPDELAEMVKTMRPGFTRPFLFFNLGSIYEILNRKKDAADAFKKAQEDIPAWPAAEKKNR